MFDVGDNNRNDDSIVVDKKKKNGKIDPDTMKIVIISVTIFIITFLIAYVFFRGKNDNYNDIKENKNEFLIYTKFEKSNTNYPKYIPYVNIKGDVISQVNEDIDLFANDFKSIDRCTLLYEYDISGVILSIVLKAVNYNVEYAPQVYFRSYNINISTLELISDEALLDFFDTNASDTKEIIENKFQFFYQDIVNEEYYQANECNYECFLKHRGVQNYMDDVNYFVKNGDLIAFKPFVFFSIYGEEDYFEDEDFEFLLVESVKE